MPDKLTEGLSEVPLKKQLRKKCRETSRVTFKGNLASYRVSVIGEDKVTFTLNTMGLSTGNDEEFHKEASLLGFKDETITGFHIDRGDVETILSKTDERLTGPWIKLISYKGWIIRVIDETDEKYLLFAVTPAAEEFNFKFIGPTTYGTLWVKKDEVEELQV